MKLSLLLLSLSFCFVGLAAGFKSYDLSEIEESASHNSYSSSIWGVVHTKLVLGLANSVDPKIGVPSRLWKSDKLKPLVVIFPGTFGDESNGQSISIARIYVRKNYHVLSMANPLAPSYIKAKLRVAPLDLPHQAVLFSKAIELAIHKVGAANISSIHFIGVSYGAFLATVVASLNGKIAQLPIKTLSLVSPPLHFGKAIQRLDNMLDRSQEVWDSQLERKLPWGDLWQLLTNNASIFIPEAFHYRAEAIFSHLGFRIQAADAFETFNRIWKLSMIPTSQREKKQWRDRLRIFKEVGRFSPRGAAFLNSKKLSDFGYWIAKVKQLGIANVSIISSLDDPLNDSKDWSTNSFANLKNETFLLKKGGHCGFLKHKLFKSALYYRIEE